MFGTLRLRPVSRDELFGPMSRQLDRMLNEVFGQDFTDGLKSKGNFPPLDAFTTKDGQLVVKTAVAGYQPDQAGIRNLVIAPKPVGDLRQCSWRGNTVHGPVSIEWQLANGEFSLDIVIPETIGAQLILPSGESVPQAKTGSYRCAF